MVSQYTHRGRAFKVHGARSGPYGLPEPIPRDGYFIAFADVDTERDVFLSDLQQIDRLFDGYPMSLKAKALCKEILQHLWDIFDGRSLRKLCIDIIVDSRLAENFTVYELIKLNIVRAKNEALYGSRYQMNSCIVFHL